MSIVYVVKADLINDKKIQSLQDHIREYRKVHEIGKHPSHKKRQESCHSGDKEKQYDLIRHILFKEETVNDRDNGYQEICYKHYVKNCVHRSVSLVKNGEVANLFEGYVFVKDRKSACGKNAEIHKC